MNKTVIYLRTSTSDQYPELQLEECKAYCVEKGFIVVDLFEEKESAFKDESKRKIFNHMLDLGRAGKFSHIVVWNMDRFSRQPEDEVLSLVKMLGLINGVYVHAVHGDLWSELVESINKLKDMGFIGEAISEFLEKIVRGLEFRRAHRESLTKSERVKSAVRKKGDVTISYKGNRWGRKALPKQTISKVLELAAQSNMSVRKIAELVKTTDKNNNQKNISKSVVHKIIQEFSTKKPSISDMSDNGSINGQEFNSK